MIRTSGSSSALSQKSYQKPRSISSSAAYNLIRVRLLRPLPYSKFGCPFSSIILFHLRLKYGRCICSSGRHALRTTYRDRRFVLHQMRLNLISEINCFLDLSKAWFAEGTKSYRSPMQSVLNQNQFLTSKFHFSIPFEYFQR